MKKLIILVCFLGLFIATSTAIAGEKARVEFNEPTKIIQVYTFFDVKLWNLCYVTVDSIFCIPYHNLSTHGKKEITRLVNQAPKDMIGDVPSIIKIH